MPGIKLNGILPPVTTPLTSGDVDYGALASNIARYNETGLRDYVPLGSNGEAVHLTVDERSRVVEDRQARGHWRAHDRRRRKRVLNAPPWNPPERRPIAEPMRCCCHPYFYKGSMTQERLTRHFTEVADHSPLPLLIYNVPQNTGVVIESATITALGAHQNIIGVKDSAGNMGRFPRRSGWFLRASR
jgi:4-hydroxy-2-oxoglutarate aldolase